MREILDYAERRTRAALAELPDGRYEADDVLEDDLRDADVPARRAVLEGDRLVLDFSGTDPQVDGNLNCPLSVTKSASFFAVRVLTDPDAPPSAGAHRPIEVRAPDGCLLNAGPAAVAAGNVETSSRVADLVLEALGQATRPPAQGQGTMNNLTLAGRGIHVLRDDGGGQGAPRRRRAERDPRRDVEHPQHPVEALESEFPVRVRELSVPGSGGAGRYRGGDGVVRELEALEPMRFGLITERRRHAPRGREGGEDGARGAAHPQRELLPSKAAGSKTSDRLRPRDPRWRRVSIR